MYSEKLKEKVFDVKICANEKCGRKFYVTKKSHTGRRIPFGVRAFNCNTCSKDCSRVYNKDYQRLYNKGYQKKYRERKRKAKLLEAY